MAARASGTFVDPEQEQQLGIFYSKLLSFILILQYTKLIFTRSDDTARFRDSGAQHRLGRVFVFSAPRPKLGCGVGWYVWRPGGGVGGEEQVA